MQVLTAKIFDVENMESRFRSIMFILTFWCWFEARKHGLEIYYSLVFSIIFLLPYISLEKNLYFLFLLYSSFSLLISTIVLTQITFSHQVFISLLHIELIRSIIQKSPVSILCIFAEFYSIYMFEVINHYIIFILMLHFLAIIGLFIVFDYQVFEPFNGISTLLTSILSIFSSQTINVPLFIIFILFSLPRFPLPFTINETTIDDLKTFLFSSLSFSINVTTFFFGVKYKSSSQQSVSLMSISNNVALFLSVIANIESRNPPNSRFSFGFERVNILCEFAMSILLLFSSYHCISISMVHIVDMRLNTRTSKELLILTTVSCFMDLFRSFSVRSVDSLHCQLLDQSELVPLIIDFTLSFAAIISTCLSYVFSINFLDPIVSLSTAAMLFSLSIPKFRKCFSILQETAPKNVNVKEIIENIPFVAKPNIKLLVVGEERGDVLTMNCQIESGADRDKIMNKLKSRIKDKIKDSTIEIISV